MLFAAAEEFRDRATVGPARVRVANVGDEKFPKVGLRALASGGDKGGDASWFIALPKQFLITHKRQPALGVNMA